MTFLVPKLTSLNMPFMARGLVIIADKLHCTQKIKENEWGVTNLFVKTVYIIVTILLSQWLLLLVTSYMIK